MDIQSNYGAAPFQRAVQSMPGQHVPFATEANLTIAQLSSLSLSHTGYLL